jgi:hypothetical protein
VTDDYNVIITDPDGNIVVQDTALNVTTTSLISLVGGSTYVHTQSFPSATWTISHNLGRRPSVTVVDSAGSVVIGEVTYLSDNSLRVEFSAGFSGQAYLN